MIEVVYIPVGSSSVDYMNYLEKKLNNGYNVIRADSCNDAIMYIIEKKDNGLSKEELHYRMEQKAIQTEMLKEIVKRDRLLKNYRDKIQSLIDDYPNELLSANNLSKHFKFLNDNTNNLLSSEIWLDKYKEE